MFDFIIFPFFCSIRRTENERERSVQYKDENTRNQPHSLDRISNDAVVITHRRSNIKFGEAKVKQNYALHGCMGCGQFSRRSGPSRKEFKALVPL